ncbi:MAG: NAD(P)-dependent oxidoreductase [Betaproteobacteria bacterium]
MADKFRIGITRDVLSPSGEPVYGHEALKVLDDPMVEWEYLPQVEPELTPETAAKYDALCVFASRVSRATVSGKDCKVKLIARFGVGYDSVDVSAITERGILLTITPDGVRRPVASSVMALTLALAHRLFTKDKLTREGRWRERGDFLGYGLTGRTLGVIGVGNIGKEVFRLAQPWNMVLVGCDPNVAQSAVADLGVKMVDLDTLLATADFISVNSLLDDKTRGLIGAREFGLMKPSAFFINTARGPVVDEKALIETLTARRIAGAGIDVFETEPIAADHPLTRLDNVILAPHAVCHTDECMRLLGEGAFGSAVDIAHGRMPKHVVNTGALKNAAWSNKLHR